MMQKSNRERKTAEKTEPEELNSLYLQQVCQHEGRSRRSFTMSKSKRRAERVVCPDAFPHGTRPSQPPTQARNPNKKTGAHTLNTLQLTFSPWQVSEIARQRQQTRKHARGSYPPMSKRPSRTSCLLRRMSRQNTSKSQSPAQVRTI
jgi:hypothetical protein